MRVIIVHNRYHEQNPSGENIVVENEVDLLREAGVDVEVLSYRSQDIPSLDLAGQAMLAVTPTYSHRALRDLDRMVERGRPDVVHVHNVYPLISPAVIRRSVHRGFPVVHSVHNYRHGCANGMYFRDGATCTDCDRTRSKWPAVWHGCYRDSALESSVLTTSMVVHQGTWKMVDRFLVLHDFARTKLEDLGIDPSRIERKHNMVPDHGPAPGHGQGLIYAGRLEVAKGTVLLLDAWAAAGVRDQTLTIAGDGPLREYVEDRSRRLSGVRFLGRLPRDHVLDEIAAARCVVIPSLWFEGAPLLLAEGLSRGRPGIVTRTGGLPELVSRNTGWASDAEVASLAGTIRDALALDPERVQEMSAACREVYRRQHSPAAVLQGLLDTYESVRLPASARRSAGSR